MQDHDKLSSIKGKIKGKRNLCIVGLYIHTTTLVMIEHHLSELLYIMPV